VVCTHNFSSANHSSMEERQEEREREKEPSFADPVRVKGLKITSLFTFWQFS